MFLPALLMLVSAGLVIFYFQTFSQKLLRRRFTQEFYQGIANANRLEFPSVRKAIEEFGTSLKDPRLVTTLKCEFLALTYLLKNTANVNHGYTYEQRHLILYFQVLYASLITCHWLGWPETSAILNLTTILQYFANVVGERVNSVQFGNLTAPPYLLNS